MRAAAQGDEADVPVITYNVYRNGAVVASGITEMGYEIYSAADGTYTVTATVDGVESAESNGFVYSGLTGIKLTGRDDDCNERTYDIKGIENKSLNGLVIKKGIKVLR